MKKILLTLLCVVTTSAFASVDIPLGGGFIPPNGKLDISLVSLLEGISYEVHCNINAPESTVLHFNAAARAWGVNPTVSINGAPIGTFGFDGINGPIKKGDNVFKAVGMKKVIDNFTLHMINLDNAISVTVNNCVATPSF